jgi:hypothetical protein
MGLSSKSRRPGSVAGRLFKAIYSINLVEKYLPQFSGILAIGFAFSDGAVETSRVHRKTAMQGLVQGRVRGKDRREWKMMPNGHARAENPHKHLAKMPISLQDH